MIQNPLEKAIIDDRGFVQIQSQENSRIFSENSEESQGLSESKIFVEQLVADGKWHSLCVTALQSLGYICKLESLKEIDKKYPDLQMGTKELFEILQEMGLLKYVYQMDYKILQRLIALYIGFSPLTMAVLQEIRQKTKKKTLKSKGSIRVKDNSTMDFSKNDIPMDSTILNINNTSFSNTNFSHKGKKDEKQ